MSDKTDPQQQERAQFLATLCEMHTFLAKQEALVKKAHSFLQTSESHAELMKKKIAELEQQLAATRHELNTIKAAAPQTAHEGELTPRQLKIIEDLSDWDEELFWSEDRQIDRANVDSAEYYERERRENKNKHKERQHLLEEIKAIFMTANR